MVNVLESLSLRIGYAKRMLVAVTGESLRVDWVKILSEPVPEPLPEQRGTLLSSSPLSGRARAWSRLGP